MIITKTEDDFVTELRSRLEGCKFSSLLYSTKVYTDKFGNVIKGGELSRYTIILGSSYIKLLESSLLELEIQTNEQKFTTTLQILAAQEVWDSLSLSLEKQKQGDQHPRYTKKGLYIHIIQGLLLNPNDMSFQLFGLEQSKIILEPGIKAKVNSAPITIAKNQIKETLPISRFKEFALDLDTVQQCKIAGETIILGE